MTLVQLSERFRLAFLGLFNQSIIINIMPIQHDSYLT